MVSIENGHLKQSALFVRITPASHITATEMIPIIPTGWDLDSI